MSRIIIHKYKKFPSKNTTIFFKLIYLIIYFSKLYAKCIKSPMKRTVYNTVPCTQHNDKKLTKIEINFVPFETKEAKKRNEIRTIDEKEIKSLVYNLSFRLSKRRRLARYTLVALVSVIKKSVVGFHILMDIGPSRRCRKISWHVWKTNRVISVRSCYTVRLMRLFLAVPVAGNDLFPQVFGLACARAYSL